MSQNATTNHEKVTADALQLVKVANVMGKRLADLESQREATATKVAGLVHPAVQALVGAGELEDGEVKEAEAWLSTHEGALTALKNLADSHAAVKKAYSGKSGDHFSIGGPEASDNTPRERKFAGVAKSASSSKVANEEDVRKRADDNWLQNFGISL